MALLYDAIDMIITEYCATIDGLSAPDLTDLARTCARTATAFRPLGVLWQREARSLPAEQRSALRLRLRAAAEIFAGAVQELRPELDVDRAAFLGAAAVNAMNSISFHRLTLPAPELEELLTTVAGRILGYRFPDRVTRTHGRTASPTPPGSRRDQLEEAATTLFARYGYDAVSIDDIGAAVGIAGPSIYNHVASKEELLFLSMRRAYAALEAALEAALVGGSEPKDRLRRVSDSYVTLTYDHGDLVTNLIAESRNLSPEHQRISRRAQVAYIGRWVDLVRELRPTEPPTESRIKVQAAQMMANSLARTERLRSRPGFADDVAELCWLIQQ